MNKLTLRDREWGWFKYDDIFTIERGKEKLEGFNNDNIPLISAKDGNNGVACFVNDGKKLFINAITIANNGSIGSAFYQNEQFYATSDISIVTLKNFTLNKFIASFLCSVIQIEKYRFNYGRKWTIERMKKSTIKLPVTEKGDPDWQFMEDYIKQFKTELKVWTLKK